jgi:hypothetical protein
LNEELQTAARILGVRLLILKTSSRPLVVLAAFAVVPAPAQTLFEGAPHSRRRQRSDRAA